jgi:hypothetical protein
VTFTNAAAATEGARIFTTAFPDAVATMQAHARTICRILYRKPEEVRAVKQQRLTLEPSSDIAYTVSSSITFSTDYIAEFARGKNQAAIVAELNGVLAHEGAHVWQYTNGGGALVEAMADYVRYKAGFYTLARRSRRPPSAEADASLSRSSFGGIALRHRLSAGRTGSRQERDRR